MRVLEFVCVYWNLYACIGICMGVLEFVCVYWNLYACLYLWATVASRNRSRFEFENFRVKNFCVILYDVSKGIMRAVTCMSVSHCRKSNYSAEDPEPCHSAE